MRKAREIHSQAVLGNQSVALIHASFMGHSGCHVGHEVGYPRLGKSSLKLVVDQVSEESSEVTEHRSWYRTAMNSTAKATIARRSIEKMLYPTEVRA